MRFPRMTTRRWMVAVAVVALVMGEIVGGVRLTRRRDLFVRLAQFHAQMAAESRRTEVLRRKALKASEDALDAFHVR